MTAALASALHVLAIGCALAATVGRDRALSATPFDDARRDEVLRADNWAGLAALLLVGSGLWRLLGGLEKPTGWYLDDPGFHLKMALFAAAWGCELLPMVTFLRWRMQLARGQPVDTRRLGLIRACNRAELALLAALVLAAAIMARGLWHPRPAQPGCALQAALVTGCVRCHAAAAPQGGLALDGDWRGALVDAPSRQWPEQRLVAPGDPDSSLLWRKLAGAQGPHGGSMPLGAPTDAALAATVRAWIAAGAPACAP